MIKKRLTIKELRESKGKSQQETANALKTSLKRYREIENGAINKLKVMEFAILTDFLKATPEEKELLIDTLK